MLPVETLDADRLGHCSRCKEELTSADFQSHTLLNQVRRSGQKRRYGQGECHEAAWVEGEHAWDSESVTPVDSEHDSEGNEVDLAGLAAFADLEVLPRC